MIFIGAAVVGGLAAADIVHERPPLAVGVAVLVALVPVGFLFYGAFGTDQGIGPAQDRADPAPRRQEPRTRLPHDEPEPVQPTPPPSTPPPLPPTRPETAPEGRSGWWDQSQEAVTSAPGELTVPASGSPPQPVPVVPYVPERVDLSRALIAQCPNCGSFGLDGAEYRGVWELSCRECTHRWIWQRGDPAPSMQVRPEVRGSQGG